MSHDDSAARLERRARTLLRAYPADYRRDRAEEVIGTLLEATPACRSFPSARDARALIAGGVGARAARNRRLTTTANLRLAVLLGLSIFLSYNVNSLLALAEIGPWGSNGLAIAVGVLSVAAALAPWVGRRTVTTAVVLPAAALFTYPELRNIPREVLWERPGTEAWLAGILVAMIALAALSGGPERLPRSWLCLPCVPLAGLAAGDLLRSSGEGIIFTSVDVPEYTILVLAAIVACWFVTDARPAFGVVAAVLPTLLIRGIVIVIVMPHISTSTGDAFLLALLPLGIGLAITVPVAWLLHRQAAPSPRPLPKP